MRAGARLPWSSCRGFAGIHRAKSCTDTPGGKLVSPACRQPYLASLIPSCIVNLAIYTGSARSVFPHCTVDELYVLQFNLHLKIRFVRPISFSMDHFAYMHGVLKYQSCKSVKLLKVTFIWCFVSHKLEGNCV